MISEHKQEVIKVQHILATNRVMLLQLPGGTGVHGALRHMCVRRRAQMCRTGRGSSAE
jgi:hypothetical protein